MIKFMPTLDEWNWYVLMLNQALIGAISSNFRMVTLRFSSNEWIVEVILETFNAEDEEEVVDIAEDFSVYVEDIKDQISDRAYKKITSKYATSREDLIIQHAEDCRVVFKRKEPTE